jgi:accessory gene regulator protein AgrB
MSIAILIGVIVLFSIAQATPADIEKANIKIKPWERRAKIFLVILFVYVVLSQIFA